MKGQAKKPTCGNGVIPAIDNRSRSRTLESSRGFSERHRDDDLLADERQGYRGVIAFVREEASTAGGLAGAELERRLLEMGFVRAPG